MTESSPEAVPLAQTALAEPAKLGPLQLSDGTSKRNVMTYYWLALSSIMLFTFVAGAQAAVLSEILGIADEDQGKITGNLGLAGEITLIIVIAVAGAQSDRIGRRPVAAFGFATLGLGLAITPFMGSTSTLIAARVVIGIGIAAVTGMITTVIADYVRDETRGTANGLLGAANGVGALLTFTLLLAIPDILADNGMDQISAIRTTYLIIGGLAMATAGVMLWGLKPGRATSDEQNEHAIPFGELLRVGLRAGKRPGLTFSYAAAFVARADLALVGAFLLLWGQQYGEVELGLSASEALQKAGILLAVANGPALLVAPVAGILADKVGRVNAVIGSMVITAVGYTSTLLIDDPFSLVGYLIAMLIGVGQISAVITSQVLVQEQAPLSIRGSVLGMFGLFGGIGIMIALKGGGELFDAWREAGPFVLFGVIAGLVAILGMVLKPRIPVGEVADDTTDLA